MSKRRNVTITLDEETARWARIEAARKDTSVSRLVAGILRERMTRDSEYLAAKDQYFAQEPRVHRRPEQRYPARDELHDRHGLR